MSRSLTFNGVKATIIFHGATSNKPAINWELVIESEDNSARINGSIEVQVQQQQQVQQVKQEQQVQKQAPTDDDINNYIKKCLIDVENSPFSNDKSKHAIKLFDYIANDGLDYLNRYEKLKQASIKRGYGLKRESKEFPELIASINAFLTAVGAPLEDKESAECNCEECEFEQTALEESEKYKRAQLMEKLFKKENLVFNDKIMDTYYEWEKISPRLNRYKKMKAFVDANRHSFEDPEDAEEPEMEARKTLMISRVQRCLL